MAWPPGDTWQVRVAKGIISKILKTTEGDGGEQWTVDNYETIAPQVMAADATFGKSGYKTIAIGVALNDGPMKYAGTLPIMDPLPHALPPPLLTPPLLTPPLLSLHTQVRGHPAHHGPPARRHRRNH